jgi:hypothetical protein
MIDRYWMFIPISIWTVSIIHAGRESFWVSKMKSEL